MSALVNIPQTLRSQARSLEGLGLNEVAWPRHAALQVLQILERLGKAILGGDVYVEEGGALRPTFDGWHCDESRGETLPRYVRRSWKEARDYINRYPEPPKKAVYFVLVVDDKRPSKGQES